MNQAFGDTASTELAVRERSFEREAAPRVPSTQSVHLIKVGTRFCVLALLLVLVDAVYVEWHGGFPIWPALTAGATAWGLLIWPAAFRRRLVEDTDFLETWCTFTVFVAFLALYGISSFPNTPYDEQLRQAVAFLQGHTYIDAPKSFLEAAQIGPYRYALHPPMPALLMMPMAALWGMNTNQNMWSLFLGALDAALAWRMLRRFRLSISARTWLTIFFAAGTILWSETIYGNTWAMPETCSICFTLLALDEVYGPSRMLLLGFYAAFAALSRYELAIAGGTYALIAMMRGRRFRDVFLMIPGFAVVGAFFIGYNEARFHSFFDRGVELTGPANAPAFGIRYLIGNIATLFFLVPNTNDTFPYFHPHYGGLSLPFTSPALVLAFKANFAKLDAALLLLTAFLVSIPSLLCYANGFAQFGTRHYLQVFPFLLVLMAKGMRHPDRLTRILITVSVIFITYGVFHIRIWGL